MSKPLRVCYFGTYRASYSRNVIMIEGLRRAGVEVLTCHVPLWQGIEDRVAVTRGGWKRPAFWWRVLSTYAKLFWRYWRVGDFDVLVCGYPGQIDVFLARPLAWLRRKPLVWDVFMSIYLIARLERELGSDDSFAISALRRIERLALQLPDKLVQDTEDYVLWLGDTHGIAAERFAVVPTGADDRAFIPPDMAANGSEPFRVVYYGTYTLNHLVEKIIDAAEILKDDPGVRFEMIGDGPERAAAEARVRDGKLGNVVFLGWMEKAALGRHVASADVCLGAFGATPQSMITVHNKIFEGLSMGRPVLTGQSPATERLFTHKMHIYLCERSGTGIADGILELRADPELRARLATEGRSLFEREFNPDAIGRKFRAILEDVLARRR